MKSSKDGCLITYFQHYYVGNKILCKELCKVLHLILRHVCKRVQEVASNSDLKDSIGSVTIIINTRIASCITFLCMDGGTCRWEDIWRIGRDGG